MSKNFNNNVRQAQISPINTDTNAKCSGISWRIW